MVGLSSRLRSNFIERPSGRSIEINSEGLNMACKTLTQGIQDERKEGESLTQCIHRLQKAGQTMTEAERDVGCNGTTPPVVPTKPGKAGAITGSAITATGFTATWTKPTSGDPVTKYVVSVTPTLAGYPKDVTGLTTDFTGATTATDYTVSVVATNATGSAAATTKKITTA